MRFSFRNNLLIIAVLLILAGVPTALLATSHQIGNHSLNPQTIKQPVTGDDQLGIDCGLGSTIAQVSGVTGGPVAPSEGTGPFETQTSCAWIGDLSITGAPAGTPTDGTNEPLVSDQDEAFATFGGGFTADVVFLQNSTSAINGFDLQVVWNPNVLRAVQIEQTGLPWNGFSPFTAISTIDNVNGIAELGQVILGSPQGGDFVLFRIRFDIIGVGSTSLHIVNVSGGITNPGAVVHQTIDGAFDSESFFDPGHTLNFSASFSETSAVNPGGANTFTAIVTGGVPPYTFAWQFDSASGVAFTQEASGNPVTVTLPSLPVGCIQSPTCIHGYRVTLVVTDSLGNTVTVVRTIPLTAKVTGPATFAIGSSQTFNGFWIGGVPNYNIAWRFCPGLASQTTVCSKPVGAPLTGTALQSQAITAQIYKFGGIYTDTMKVTDTAVPGVTSTPSVVIYTFPVTVTSPVNDQAYTITITSSNLSPAPNSPVTFTAVAHYNSSYPAAFRSSTILVRFNFGDSGSAASTITLATGGANSTSVSHTYLATGTFSVSATGQETGTAAVSQIQENSNTLTETVALGSPLAVTISCPSTGTVGTVVPCTAIATGGTAPYTFGWTATGGTPASGTGSSFSTTYNVKGSKTISVTVTDSATPTPGSASASATVTIAALPLAASVSGPTTGAVGTGVTFTASATGGTSPYTFAWTATGGSPASGTGASFAVTYSVKGSYTVSVTATDGNAATSTASATITIAALPLAVTVSCPSTGTVGIAVSCTATGSGGTTPYTFAWTATGGSPASGSGASFATTYSSKGTFSVSVTVTDTNAKTATGSASVVISPLSLGVTVGGPTIGTVGTAVTFTATGSGGTTPYSFAWTGTGGTPASGTAASFSTTYSVKGSYTVSVIITDANAKTATASASIVISPLALTTDFTFSPTLVTPGSPTTFTATVTGGTAPYSYSWSFGDGSAAGTTNPVSHIYTTAGPFTVTLTVTDSNAKTTTTNHTVGGALTVTVTGPTTGTVGVAITFTASCTGGTPPCTFTWTATGGTPSSGTGSSFTTTYNVKGSYTVTATGTDSATPANVASGSATITIAALTLAASVSGPTTGTVATAVTFTASATGGTTPYSFGWTATGGTPASGNGASFTTTYNVKGTYTVTVTATDSNGKTATASASLTIAPLALAVTIGGPTTGTVGTAVTFTSTGSGGTTPYTFAWTATGGIPSSGTGASFSTTYSVKGSHTVSVIITDANAKTAFATASITVSPLTLAATISGPTTGGINTALTFTATGTGGTTPYTFAWTATGGSPASGTGASFTTMYSASGPQTVSVTVTDTNAQTATASTTVTISPGALSVTISCPTTGTVNSPVTCTATETGGTAPITFAWTATGGTPAAGTGASFTTTYSTKGTYTISVTATDATGTTATNSATITISPLALAVTIAGPTTGTVGTAVTFTATGSGGTAPYTFAWTATSGSPASGSGATLTTMYNAKGSHTVSVTVTDANAKTATASATITISPLTLTAAINGPTTGTAGSPVTFTATGSGGTSPYTFAWTATGTPSTGTGASFTTTYATKGTFTVSVTVTDSNAQTATATATITISPLTLAVTVNGPTTGGIASAVTFTATGSGGTTPYTFAWIATGGSPASGTGSSFTTMYANTGTFTVSVTITDANAQTATSSKQITISTALAVSITGPTTGSVGTPVTFTSTVTGGTSPFTYAWTATGGSPSSGTASSFITTYNVKGTYTISLTVTDAGAATASATASITISPLTLAVTVNGPSTGTVGSPVTLTASPTGGTLPYSFSWTATGGTPSTGTGSSLTTTYNVKGTFTVGLTVTDANGKTASTTQTITISPLALKDDFTFNPSSPTTGQSVTFTPTVSGGTTPYSYAWNFGDGTSSTSTSPSHAYATAGTFTVTLSVTDANNVQATATHTITVLTVTAVGDFSISVNPGHLSLSAGASRDVNVVVHSINFAGTVTLTVTITPLVANGPSGTFSKSTLTLVVNSTANSKLHLSTLTSTPPGSYIVTVTATSGGLSHSDVTKLTVTGFSLTVAPSSLTVQAGSSGSFTLTVKSEGFSGVVHLTASIDPARDNSPSLSLSSSNIILSNSGTGSASLQVSSEKNTVLGTYTIVVNAASHGLIRSSIVHLILADHTGHCQHHHQDDD